MARLNHVKSFRGTSKTEDGNLTCGKCRIKITPGTPYQWWANRSPGARSGIKNVRCMDCTPSLAERTPGRAGQLMQLQENASKSIQAIIEATDVGDFESVAAEIAANIEEIADEVREAGENMEQGFEHPTEQSENLVNCGDELAEKAQDLESMDFEAPPDEAQGEGGSGNVTPKEEDEYNEALEEWRDTCRNQIEDVVNELELTY